MNSKPRKTNAQKGQNLRRIMLIQNNGTPEKQKDALVNEIILSFTMPERWPTTDSERCELLRKFYRMAFDIRQTESA